MLRFSLVIMLCSLADCVLPDVHAGADATRQQSVEAGVGGVVSGGGGSAGEANSGVAGAAEPQRAAGTGGRTGVSMAGSGGSPTANSVGAAGIANIAGMVAAVAGAGGSAGRPPVSPSAGSAAPNPNTALACNVHTTWLGDEYCIMPPPPSDGFQVHVGPANYDQVESNFILPVGAETNESIKVTSPNAADVYYYFRQYRLRPGAHHIIVSGQNKRVGASSQLSEDNPRDGVIAPENKGIGIPLSAHTPLDISLHYVNTGDKPILKEAWINFWYRKASEVTQPTLEIFDTIGMNIPAGAHVVKRSSCVVPQAGRLLTVYGHVHSHNKRFSVWRVRGAVETLLHESYTWDDPYVSQFSSAVMNAALNPTMHSNGGYSGIVDLAPGDKIEFECEIVNDTNATFLGVNAVKTDEMCVLQGDSVGTAIPQMCELSERAVN